MPSRIIRESALTSRTLDVLSHGAERLWWRLTVVVDDYGRFDADPRVVRSRCFPLKHKLGLRHVSGWVEEMVAAGLIQLYHVGDHTYGAIIQWPKYQRAGRSKPKFPDPPQLAANGDNPPQSAASCGLESRVVSRDTRSREVVNRESRTVPDVKLSTQSTGLEPIGQIIPRVVV